MGESHKDDPIVALRADDMLPFSLQNFSFLFLVGEVNNDFQELPARRVKVKNTIHSQSLNIPSREGFSASSVAALKSDFRSSGVGEKVCTLSKKS